MAKKDKEVASVESLLSLDEYCSVAGVSLAVKMSFLAWKENTGKQLTKKYWDSKFRKFIARKII